MQKTRRSLRAGGPLERGPVRPPVGSRPPSPALRPGRRWVGLGVRHALFPDSLAFGAQLRSSSLLAASSPTLHRPARTCGSCSALQRSRPPGRVTFRGRLVERGFSARLAGPSVDGLPPDRAGAGCDHPFPGLFPQGSAGATGLVAPPGSPRYGSCLFALKLRFLRMQATPFSAPPAFGSYRPGPLIPPRGRPRTAGLTPRLDRSPCVPRLRSRDLWTAFRWSDTVRNNPPHWLTVATAGLAPTVSAFAGGNPTRGT